MRLRRFLAASLFGGLLMIAGCDEGLLGLDSDALFGDSWYSDSFSDPWSDWTWEDTTYYDDGVEPYVPVDILDIKSG